MGFDAVHEWIIATVLAVAPRVDPTHLFTCVDDGTGRTTPLEDLKGKDRYFDVRLAADGMPVRDEEMECCDACGNMIAEFTLRFRYRSEGDQAALTRRVGADQSQVVLKIESPSTWPAYIYGVEVQPEREIQSIRPQQPAATGPYAGLQGDDPEEAFLISTRIRIWYEQEA